MNHSFDIDIAQDVGLEAAIIFQNIQFWIARNVANQENIKDGYAWVYNSRAAWCELMPYMGEKQIRNALERLIEKGFVVRDTFSFGSRNRTYWYRLGERAKLFGPNGQTKTDINTDINKTDITPLVPQQMKAKKNENRGQRLDAYLERLGVCDGEMPGEWSLWASTDLQWHHSRSYSVFDTFRDYWRAQPGAKGVKADWFATWRNWCRREAERKPYNGGQRSTAERNTADALTNAEIFLTVHTGHAGEFGWSSGADSEPEADGARIDRMVPVGSGTAF